MLVPVIVAFALVASGPFSWQASQAVRDALATIPCLVEARSQQEARLIITITTQHLPLYASAGSGGIWAVTDGHYLVRIAAVLDRQQVVHDSSHSGTQMTITVQVGPAWLRLPVGNPEAVARAGASALASSLAAMCMRLHNRETYHGRFAATHG